jgi:hypothetical protein
MARKLKQRQKFYKSRRWLWQVSRLLVIVLRVFRRRHWAWQVSLLLLLVALPACWFFGKSHALVAGCPAAYPYETFMCQYQGGYTLNGGDQAILQWNGHGGIGTEASPSQVKPGDTVDLTVGFNSTENSAGQRVLGWLNIATDDPSALGISANGDRSQVFSNGCFVAVAQIPGYETNPSYNHYGNNSWPIATDPSGVYACGNLEERPTRLYLVGHTPGYFATSYNGQDTPNISGNPVGASVVWYNGFKGANSSGRDGVSIKFASSITQPLKVCMRYHVSITTDANSFNNVVSGNASAIASNDLSNITGVKGSDDLSESACFQVVPQNICDISNCGSATSPTQCDQFQAINSGSGNQEPTAATPSGGGSWSSANPVPKQTIVNIPGVTPAVTNGTVGWAHVHNWTWRYIPNGENVTASYYRQEALTVHHLHNNGRPYPNNGNTEWVLITGSAGSSPAGPCYNATCNMSVTSGGIITPGSSVTVNATITNQGPMPLPKDLNGLQLALNGTAGSHPTGFGLRAPPPLSIGPVNFSFSVPSSATPYNYTVSLQPVYNGSGGFALGPPCPPVTFGVYIPFSLSGSATVNFSPSAEDPIGVGGGPGITYNTTVCNYNGSICTPASWPVNAPATSSFSGPYCPAAGSSLGGPWAPGTTTALSGSCTPSSINAGDTYCAKLDLGWTMGYVGPGLPAGSDVVDQNTPASYQSCPKIHNEPFFKVYNSSVSTGSGYPPVGGGSCSGGELAGWNNDTGTNPSSEDFGSGTQLSALAAMGITGFASNQSVPPALNGPPISLSFANNGVVPGLSIDSPSLGGNFGNTDCQTPNVPPANTVQPGGSSASITALDGASGAGQHSYSYGDASTPVNLTLRGGTISPKDNLSIFVIGNIYISGDIIYGGDTGSGQTAVWNSPGDVPSFTLHATGNIYIDPGVIELDGIYTAQPASANTGGKIYTCSAGTVTYVDGTNPSTPFTPMASGELYGNCKNQLTIYGNFVANQVNLMRTFGSLRDDTPILVGAHQPFPPTCSNPGAGLFAGQTCAAEVFDFSPEIYLSNTSGEQPSHGTLQYQAVTSLPPVL